MKSIVAFFAVMSCAVTMVSAQNVGIGETAPASKLAIKGSLSVGSAYSTTSAPTDGAIILGNVGIGTASPFGVFDVETTNSAFHVYNFTGSGGIVLAAELHGNFSNGALLRFTGGTSYMDIGQDGSGDFIINQGSTRQYQVRPQSIERLRGYRYRHSYSYRRTTGERHYEHDKFSDDQWRDKRLCFEK